MEFHLSQTYHEGLLRLEEKAYAKARELFESVLKDPLISNAQVDNSTSDSHLRQLRFLALKNLATVFLQQGAVHNESALQCYLQAVEIDSKDSVVWNQLGTLSWNCMEKLLEVLIAIGDEVACLLVADLILNRWPSHARALYVKNTIEDPETLPFAPRGIDKLEPKHVRLKFPEKRKTISHDCDNIMSKKRKQNQELNLVKASWTTLVDAILGVLLPPLGRESETGSDLGRWAHTKISFSLPSRITKERESYTDEGHPHERRSVRLERLRSCKPGKEELEFSDAKDMAKVVFQFLAPFIVNKNGTENYSGAGSSFICHPDGLVYSSESEKEEVMRFVADAANNYGAYHIGHMLLEEVAHKVILCHDIYVKLLQLEKLTRQWGWDRTIFCSLFLAELYYDFGSQSDTESKRMEFFSEASYHLCKVIEQVALDCPDLISTFSHGIDSSKDHACVNDKTGEEEKLLDIRHLSVKLSTVDSAIRKKRFKIYDGASVLTAVIGDIQSLLLTVMSSIVKTIFYQKISGLGSSNLGELLEARCFVDAAIAFCKLQHLDPVTSVKTQVELLVAVHDLLAEHGLCCAGKDDEGEEGIFLKLAIKHLLALDMKLKSSSNSSSGGTGKIPSDELHISDPEKTSQTGSKSNLTLDSCTAQEEECRALNRETEEVCDKTVCVTEPKRNVPDINLQPIDGECLSSHVADSEHLPIDDEREKMELAIENALDQSFFCLYGLNIKSGLDTSTEEDLAIHRNTTHGDYETKEQCADVFQYILPYAKASSRSNLVKLRRVLRAIRKQFPQPPDHVLIRNFIDNFLDDPDICEDRLSELAGVNGDWESIKNVLFPDGRISEPCKTLTAGRPEPYSEVYGNLYYFIAQAEETSATDKWPGFVLNKEGEEFVEQNTKLFKYDLLYNPSHFEGWRRLANIYDESQIHELLALVYYDCLQNVVPIYDQRTVAPVKDSQWLIFCRNSMKHFEKAFQHKSEWLHAFYLGKLCEKQGFPASKAFSYYNKAITLNPSAVDPVVTTYCYHQAMKDTISKMFGWTSQDLLCTDGKDDIAEDNDANKVNAEFSLCLEDIIPVALGRYIQVMISSIRKAEAIGPSGTTSVEHLLEKMFHIYMDQMNIWSDLSKLPEVKSPELTESSLFGYLHLHIQSLESNLQLDTLEGINEKIRKRFKIPKLSNSNSAKVCKHASIAWCRVILIKLALITPLPDSGNAIGQLHNVPEDILQLFVDLHPNELWSSLHENPTHTKVLEMKWDQALSRIKNIRIRQTSEENMEAATALLKSAYNFYKESSSGIFPSGINLYTVPSKLAKEGLCSPGKEGIEVIDLSVPRKILLWSYVLVHGRYSNILAVVKYCEDNAKVTTFLSQHPIIL
ncbi:hypothetical protein QJS10_CPB19g00805 [Acorus calamus]|uniref:Calcineurin-binding protein cabin-1 n=1 Tax=Acorus calamus TaxID=4465 RepID=A0AAV9CHT4_ACOCL|nr:hypothetical protein QJS10_CPB19g00805 [Acorus calamus]